MTRILAEYNTDIIDDLYQTIVEKGTGVRRVSTQKYHNIVTLEVMDFIQTSMTTEVVNMVVSISTNFYD